MTIDFLKKMEKLKTEYADFSKINDEIIKNKDKLYFAYKVMFFLDQYFIKKESFFRLVSCENNSEVMKKLDTEEKYLPKIILGGGFLRDIVTGKQDKIKDIDLFISIPEITKNNNLFNRDLDELGVICEDFINESKFLSTDKKNELLRKWNTFHQKNIEVQKKITDKNSYDYANRIKKIANDFVKMLITYEMSSYVNIANFNNFFGEDKYNSWEYKNEILGDFKEDYDFKSNQDYSCRFLLKSESLSEKYNYNIDLVINRNASSHPVANFDMGLSRIYIPYKNKKELLNEDEFMSNLALKMGDEFIKDLLNKTITIVELKGGDELKSLEYCLLGHYERIMNKYMDYELKFDIKINTLEIDGEDFDKEETEKKKKMIDLIDKANIKRRVLLSSMSNKTEQLGIRNKI